ncbi:dephospho-CoA kinase [Thermomonas sp. HDW16]|uniref:dephospho-CoA kinase n=1 Tax=Thermomonas sp. HDW16 TaxID=2714945 RepID=UPI00140BE674|nr:dephospho-CoA kinase [Thermomonas sp. HDW16]QIL21437.1 dephospho-CoA kinase [Thermomonas sp. HDW16]
MSMYVIGLTGGIASGKSAVSQRFEALGIFVADADQAAHDAVAVGSDGLADVVDMFGEGVLAADGSLDRPAMRRRVFADPDARKRLEGIIHPRVRELLHEACLHATGPYTIAAVPLLAESGGRKAYPWLRRILVVDVPESVQLQRVLLRDGIDEVLAQRMIKVQATRQQRLAIADDVLVNDGALDMLDERVAALDRLYRALAAG